MCSIQLAQLSYELNARRSICKGSVLLYLVLA